MALAPIACLILAAAAVRTPTRASVEAVGDVALEPSPVTLWAWERPEALGFVDSAEVDVAALVGTLRLAGDRIEARARLQPLEVPRSARMTAVVRVESDAGKRPALTPGQRRQAVAAILAWTSPGFAALQIDFDATVSERGFYRRLLEDLRRDLSPATPLSITALASWCLGDRWLEGLPIEEAVPMLFRMGTDDQAVRVALARGVDFAEPLCRQSYGLSSDEPMPPLEPGRRLFLFHPRAWTEADYLAFRRRLAAATAGGGQAR